MNIDRIIIRERIRQDLGDLVELEKSIQEFGLIAPIIINTDCVLLAGYRRYLACRKLGMQEIPVRMITTRDGEHDLMIELEDNELNQPLSPEDYQTYERKLQQINEEKRKAVENKNEIKTVKTTADEISKKPLWFMEIQHVQLALPAKESNEKS